MNFEPRCRHGNIRSAEPCRDCDERDALRARVAELEGQHRVGMLHACALLSLTVYDSDGEPLDQTKLLAMCDESDADLIADDGPEGDGFRYA